MPVIGIPVRELTSRLGRPLEGEELLRVLGSAGCDVDGYETWRRWRCAGCGEVLEAMGEEPAPSNCDRCGADLSSPAALTALPDLEVVRMDLLAVRPDIFDPGGLCRALRGLLGEEEGLITYACGPPALTLTVDDSVRRPQSSRPFIAAAVLENVALDEDRIRILMKLQENLHWALGRDRKHASIGVYDLDSFSSSEGERASPELEYTTEPPSYRFVPLGALGTSAEHERSLEEILREHPKGMAYARLLAGMDRYPILRARDGLVLSMPPIINSEQTKVHAGSRRLFVDVTGSGPRVVHRTLNILVTSLLELDPGMRLRGVRLRHASRAGVEGAPEADPVEQITPDLTPQAATISVSRTARLLGCPLDAAELARLLRRMRHGVEDAAAGATSGAADPDLLRVRVAAYRSDILHERDLMEDAAIARGYGSFERTLVSTQTVGKHHPLVREADAMREVMVGLGFLEIISLPLTAPAQSDQLLGHQDHPERVLLENPISQEQVQLRTSLMPGLLWTLARNRHHRLPQQIFEVGEVTLADPTAETGARERRHVAFALISPRTGFADLRALVEAVIRELGWPLRLEPLEQPFLIAGRAARVIAPGGLTAGAMGEAHPAMLERLGLQNPAILCELALPEAGVPQPYRSIAW